MCYCQNNVVKAVVTLVKIITVLSVAAMFSACEAPLNLDQVERESQKPLLRFDRFQAAASWQFNVAVVSSTGAVISSANGGRDWLRQELPGRPSLIDITACPVGDFFALDTERRIWMRPKASEQWHARQVATPETLLSVHCAPDNTLWLSGSFSTLLSSSNQGEKWQVFSLQDDVQLTAVEFVDDQHGFAVGEFGTVIRTLDGGNSWQALPAIPNDFYPMAADFLDRNKAWVGGLDGVIWHTVDGGQNWQRQQTVTRTPVYGIKASAQGVFAVGGGAKLEEWGASGWQELVGAPQIQSYLRGLTVIDGQALIAAGGGGTLEVIALVGGDSQWISKGH